MAPVGSHQSAEEGQGRDSSQEALGDRYAVGAPGEVAVLVGEVPALGWHSQSLCRRTDCWAHGRWKEGLAERAHDAARTGWGRRELLAQHASAQSRPHI